MREESFGRLLAAMGPAIGPALTGAEEGLDLLRAHGDRGTELAGLLLSRNGCYSGARSLLIRPLADHAAPKGIVEWNDARGWPARYEADLEGALFFAEDLFGEQFALRASAVWRFDPETGEWRFGAPTLDAWADALLDEEGRPELDSPLALRWQAEHGELPAGKRLRPPVPFLFAESADATLEDYQAIPEDEVMGSLADIANALRDAPDGSKVILRSTGGPDEGAAGTKRRRRRWWWRPFG